MTDLAIWQRLKGRKLSILLVLGTILIYPFETTVAPPKDVLVVTHDGTPIFEARVRQSWQNYSVESEGHEEELITDSEGRIRFPRRTVRASLLWRVIRPVANVLGQGVHASFGIQTDIYLLGDLSAEPMNGKKVEPRPGEIVFKKSDF
jgi:hypothetical protein